MEFYEDYICRNCKNVVENKDGNYRYCPYCGEDLLSRKEIQIKLDTDIEEVVYNWLSKMLRIDTWLVSETIKNQMATVFLLIWPILETKIFNSDMSHAQIKDVAESVKNEISSNDLEEIFLHFHDRFQSDEKYRKLKQDREWTKIDYILQDPPERVSKKNRIIFMIFVVYRYRNNIFHGIKSISQWSDFSKEIQLCIKFMILLGNSIEVEGQSNGKDE